MSRTALQRAARRIATLVAAAPVVIALSSGAACSNEHLAFCEETTTSLCARCWECADSDEEASALCGLDAETDQPGCAIILEKVCVADDTGYNTESARTCQERVERLSCDALRTQAKPEVCGRLF